MKDKTEQTKHTLQALSIYSAFADAVKLARKRKKLSQADLAKAVGLGEQIIGKYERGETLPKTEHMLEIARVLDIKINISIDAKRVRHTHPEITSPALRGAMAKRLSSVRQIIYWRGIEHRVIASDFVIFQRLIDSGAYLGKEF